MFYCFILVDSDFSSSVEITPFKKYLYKYLKFFISFVSYLFFIYVLLKTIFIRTICLFVKM